MNESKMVMKCQRKKKLDAVQKFGGKCQICGYDKCINALEFHHIEDKKEAPTYVIMRWSWERAKKELEKCVLLCANCHREVHYKEVDISFSLNLLDWHTMQCQNCKKRFDTKQKNAKYCSTTCWQIKQQKTDRPSKEELETLVNSHSFLELGKKFGVSDNAIRKWCKSYGLETKNRKYSHNSCC